MRPDWLQTRLRPALATLLAIFLVSVTAGSSHFLVAAARADDGSDKGESGGHSGTTAGGGEDGGAGSAGGGGGSEDAGQSAGDGEGENNGGVRGGTANGSGSPGGGLQAGAGGNYSDRAESGEVVVLADRPDILIKARRMGFSLIDERRFASLDLSMLRLKTPAHVDGELGLAMLREAFPHLTADLNSLYAPYSEQSDQVVSLPEPDYARRMIGWSGGEGCGAGFRIGMIDTAPGPSPALSGQKMHVQSFLDSDAPPADSGHGTAIASLLVGHGVAGRATAAGLLPAADLYAAGVFERDGTRSEASAFAIAGALDWMVANHVSVVNISLSGEANSLLAIAAERATARGSVLIAAAGNGGPGGKPAYPAALPDAIAVTAVDQDGHVYAKANEGDYIAFAAPGVRIWVPEPDALGEYLTGTSLAAPFVAGAAALELIAGGPPSAELVRKQLATRAIHLGQPGKNPVYGYGLVQAAHGCGMPVSGQ